ncbi:sensor histidine kinase [Pontibacter silvestris]|uniref:Sensor histidine kinase n=1 Tax=Pontibacter silvestris TaxID=2305183 RepID=A0ABW4WW58_9BACT|nr:sensor histidine kinase [Pontibacter silvestris]MCC9138022.1 sensor histidine kinase [Pontibacter silvestris]
MASYKLHHIKLRFWQQWLLHSLLLWAVLTLYDLCDYWVRIQNEGYFIFYEDGSPLTVGRRFYNQVVYDWLWTGVLVAVYFVETAYHIAFGRLKKGYKIIGIFLGIACVIFYGVDAYIHYNMNGFVVWRRLVAPFYPILLSAVYAFMYVVARHYIHQRINSAETLSEQSLAELKALKAQVNPHFFFNTLNSLYGTALEVNAPHTAESIDQLAGMMRYTMNEAEKDYTSITNEIKFLEDYLHLQRLRLPNRNNIKLKTGTSYDGKPCTIAPMLLIPFIENAFKYGISIDHICWVHIQLNIKNQQLLLLVENRILKEHSVSQGQGTGIENTQKRLRLLYPDQHKLTISQTDAFKVELHIELHL